MRSSLIVMAIVVVGVGLASAACSRDEMRKCSQIKDQCEVVTCLTDKDCTIPDQLKEEMEMIKEKCGMVPSDDPCSMYQMMKCTEIKGPCKQLECIADTACPIPRAMKGEMEKIKKLCSVGLPSAACSPNDMMGCARMQDPCKVLACITDKGCTLPDPVKEQMEKMKEHCGMGVGPAACSRDDMMNCSQFKDQCNLVTCFTDKGCTLPDPMKEELEKIKENCGMVPSADPCSMYQMMKCTQIKEPCKQLECIADTACPIPRAMKGEMEKITKLCKNPGTSRTSGGLLLILAPIKPIAYAVNVP